MHIRFVINTFFDCTLYKFGACFYLSIALVMVWSWYCLLYVKVIAVSSEFIWNKITTCILHNFLQLTIFWKKMIGMVLLSYLLIGLLSFDDRELTVVIYNTKVVLLGGVNMSAPITFHHLPEISWWIIFSLWLHLLKIKTCRAIFYVVFNIIFHTCPINWFTH